MEQNGNDEYKNIKSKIETKDATFDEGCIFWNLATILEIHIGMFQILVPTRVGILPEWDESDHSYKSHNLLLI